MVMRHFAFFRQDTGEYVRESAGPVPDPDIDPALTGDARSAALNAWATDVSAPQAGEIGLDVTHIGWPIGDFCYCRFDVVDRSLHWGPPRYYVEIALDRMEIAANQESHRPVRSTDPTRLVIDITGTALEPLHGHLFGRLVRRSRHWALEPRHDRLLAEPTQRALEAARIDLDMVTVPIRELAHV